ncbi:acyl-CoA dehydrogenase family protein [Sporichthya sp.]|uniref:acyl-CoA dehydrogenase family protein n=1 Tax=Sporichthya sp. TaxID=65475 RepID=UPI00184270C7|nr:acyl-CoA dehydrogenase family protein [Sporichthya sp.]MBA3745593.1 acyl-CoA dehydrogenase family protein [Sporichthya sp.]
MSTARVIHPRSVLGPDLPAVPYAHPLRAEFRAWLSSNGPEGDYPLEQDDRFAYRRAWQRSLAAGGWAGIGWPVEYGGRGAGSLDKFMYYEELALAGCPEPANTPGILLLGPTLMEIGTPQLRERFLPKILAGDEMWAQCFSEPDSGSDLASMRTKARLEGDEWLIDGSKTWSTFAQYADFVFVLSRTEPGSEKHRGLTLLIVPVDQPGVTVRPIEQISGDAEFCEVFLDNARAPKDWVVGEIGEGWKAAMTLFQFERADQGFTDHARLLVELHEVRELPADLDDAERDELRRRWALLWTRCQELRMLNLRMAALEDDGVTVGPLGSLSNLVWGELYKEIYDFVAETVGGTAAVARDTVASHDRVHSRAASIYSGTSEIQRNIVAERLVGLPR